MIDGIQAGESGPPPRRATDLPTGECWRLLASVSLGRVVFTMDALPAIRPVNHLVDGDVIIIRSHLGSAITAHADAAGGVVVCYEADALDPDQHTGWSVIATGTARLVTDPAAISRYQQRLEPWAAGQMDHIIAITPHIITGIRLDGTGRRPVVREFPDTL
jgi:nitroimidazol reductase NimA-like FMN-containing flavoprotein (pyridoxamine 5'-phosphate oxidase superfamily)